MKVKLFTFLGLLIATVIVSVAFGAAPVQAKGEKYKWVNRSTIEVSGGVYSELSFIADNNESWNKRFSGDGYNKRVSVIPFANATEIGCTVTLNLSISADNRHGTLKISEGGIKCHKDSPLFDLDKKFTLSNPSKGPAMGGSELEYKKGLNCTEAYAGGHPSQRGKNIERCEAVKECVVEKKKTEFQCLQAWALCMEENNENTGKCKDSVGAGNVDETKEEEDQPKNETTCAVDGIGWIICPVITFIASSVDAAYEYVLSTLLEVQPLFTTGESEGVYDAWSIMRNFANVAFVIAFMVIIFSQITSVGITNYGIKKMLPRLVISAILVNISYWICAAAVDISNIAGASIKDMFDAVGASLKPPEVSGIQTGNGWTGIAAVILAGTAVAVFSTLSAFLPILVTVAFAIVTVLLVLALRQALIILLIVISPLAFVAYLLPNTEDLFTKWRKLLVTLLLMYPIIGLIFGASALASMVITSTEDDNIIVQIMGAGIAIIPLFITPIVMKTAGGVLNRFGAVVNNPNKGPVDRLRKRAEGYRDRRKNIAGERRIGRARSVLGGSGRTLGAGNTRRRRTAAWFAGAGTTAGMNADQRNTNAEKALAEAKQGYIAGRAADDTKYARSIAGPTGDVGKIQAAAVAAEKAETAKAIENARISANIPPGDIVKMGDEFAKAVKDGDSVKARAMQDTMLSSGSAGIAQYRTSMEGLDKSTIESPLGSDLRENMLQNHASVKKDAADLIKQAASGSLMKDASNKAATWQGLSDDELVHQKKESITLALDSNAVSQEQAMRIANNDELAKHLENTVRTRIENIATQPPQTPPVT